MKRILLTTALVAFAAAPAMAQTADEPYDSDVNGTLEEPLELETDLDTDLDTDGTADIETEFETDDTFDETVVDEPGGDTFITGTGGLTLEGSEFIGKNVYVAEHGGHPDAVDGIPEDWENVATVGDVLISRDGNVEAVLIDIGGFLGIGARTVALDMDALSIVHERESDDFHVVFTSSREALENAPEYDRSADLAMRGEAWGASPEGADVLAPAGNDIAFEDGERMTAEPPEGYQSVAPDTISVDELRSATVYDMEDSAVASVSDVLMSENGAIDQVIVDVGGFLGIGAKPVALDFSELDLHQTPDRGDLRVHVSLTREQLEAMPDYEG